MRNEAKVTMMIPVELLDPHPQNPRKNLGDLTELTASIRANGILQNLTVMDEGERFRVLIGHRRLAAAKEAGVKTVPCYIMEPAPDEKTQVLIMLQENMQRSDLTLIEEADGFQMALDLGCTVNDLAKQTGLSGQTIRNRMTISQLDRSILDKMQYQLTIMDFIELAKVEDIKKRNEILKESKSHEALKYSIARAIEDQAREKKKAAAVKIVKDAGFKKYDKMNYYGIRILHSIPYDGKPAEIPAELTARASEEGVYYRESWNAVEILKVEAQPAAETTKQNEEWRIDQENKAKTIGEIWSFLRIAINGNVDVKDPGDAYKELLDLAILNPGDGPASFRETYRSLYDDTPNDEDLKAFEPKFRKMSATLWMLISCAPNKWSATTDISSFVEIIKKYGFTLTPELGIWLRSKE